MSKFGEKIKELRIENNISRKESAKSMFVSVRLVSYWENYKRECDFETLIKIADYFEERINFILGRTDS